MLIGAKISSLMWYRSVSFLWNVLSCMPKSSPIFLLKKSSLILENPVDGINTSFCYLGRKKHSSWVLDDNRFCEHDSNMARFSVKWIAFLVLFERRRTALVIEGIASFHQKFWCIWLTLKIFPFCPCWDSAIGLRFETADVHYQTRRIIFRVVSYFLASKTEDMITKSLLCIIA